MPAHESQSHHQVPWGEGRLSESKLQSSHDSDGSEIVGPRCSPKLGSHLGRSSTSSDL